MRHDATAAFSWRAVEFPEINFRPYLVSVMHSVAPVIDFEERFTNRLGLALPKYRLSPSLWKYLKREFARRGDEDCGPQSFSDVARTFSPRYYKDGSEILLWDRTGNPRRLTPRECSRLMGFDGDGSTPFKIVVSDTQAYKQFGGASAVPVVEAIALALAPKVVGVKPGAGRRSGGARFWSARI